MLQSEQTDLRGMNILVVEDEYMLAMDLARQIEHMGATVLGPAPTLSDTNRYVDIADAAILDIMLGGEKVFPLADKLAARRVPFVFLTAYDGQAIPANLKEVRLLHKPATAQQLARALLQPRRHEANGHASQEEDGVVALLPRLRLAARMIERDHARADRLVERALELAIAEAGRRPADVALADWLDEMIERAAAMARPARPH